MVNLYFFFIILGDGHSEQSEHRDEYNFPPPMVLTEKGNYTYPPLLNEREGENKKNSSVSVEFNLNRFKAW